MPDRGTVAFYPVIANAKNLRSNGGENMYYWVSEEQSQIQDALSGSLVNKPGIALGRGDLRGARRMQKLEL